MIVTGAVLLGMTTACGASFTDATGAGGSASTSSAMGGAGAVGSGGDGGAGGAGGSAACPPHGVSHLSDDFSSAELAPTWGVAGAPQAGQRDGYAFIAIDDVDEQHSWIYTNDTFTLWGCSASIQVRQPFTCDECITTFGIVDTHNVENYAWIAFVDEQLIFAVFEGNSWQEGKVVDVESMPAFWRIRESDRVLAMDTSQDGGSFEEQFTVDRPAWSGDIRLEFHGGGIADSGTTQEMRVDNVNILP